MGGSEWGLVISPILVQNGPMTSDELRNWSYHGKTAMDRFWPKIKKTDTCWLWTGARLAFGYGILTVRNRLNFAHRISWLFHCGDIPSGLYVLHRCDVPNCVRPDHLFLGTYAMNFADARAKGRWKPLQGEQIGTSKLKAKQVIKIRRLFDTGRFSKDALGKRFGVTDVMIGNIVRRKWWKSV